MNNKIYIYDNQTGIEIPSRINSTDVEIPVGKFISNIHASIEDNSFLFCVVTNIKSRDFVVQTEKDEEILNKILVHNDYGLFDIKVSDKSSWYSDKVYRNIIISDNANIEGEDLSKILGLYIDELNKDIPKVTNIFRVYNNRSGKELFKTPLYDEAVKHCDETPCSVVINSNGMIIYRSGYGRVSIPANKTSKDPEFNIEM